MSNIYSPLNPSSSNYYGEPEKVKDETKLCVCPGEASNQESFKEPHKDVIYEDMQSALEDIIKQIPFSKTHNYEISYNEYHDENVKHPSEMHSSTSSQASSTTESVGLKLTKESESNSSPTPSEIEKGSLSSSSPKDNPKVIKQVIFIEPPEYIYKHEFNIQPASATPRTVIYVFPPQVKHEYNITQNEVRMMNDTQEPIVYYLNTDNHLEEEQTKSVPESDTKKINKPILPQSYKNSESELPHSETMINLSQTHHAHDASQESDEMVNSRDFITRKIQSVLEKEKESTPQSKTQTGDYFQIDERLRTSALQAPIVGLNSLFDPYKRITAPENNFEANKHSNYYKSITLAPVLSSTNWQIPKIDASEIVEVKDKGVKSNFEIIPAILQNYFYISPEENYPL